MVDGGRGRLLSRNFFADESSRECRSETKCRFGSHKARRFSSTPCSRPSPSCGITTKPRIVRPTQQSARELIGRQSAQEFRRLATKQARTNPCPACPSTFLLGRRTLIKALPNNNEGPREKCPKCHSPTTEPLVTFDAAESMPNVANGTRVCFRVGSRECKTHPRKGHQHDNKEAMPGSCYP